MLTLVDEEKKWDKNKTLWISGILRNRFDLSLLNLKMRKGPRTNPNKIRFFL
jgi:hypothetical protein